MNQWAFLFWCKFLQHPEMFCVLRRCCNCRIIFGSPETFIKSAQDWIIFWPLPRTGNNTSDTSTVTVCDEVGGKGTTHSSAIQEQCQSCPDSSNFEILEYQQNFWKNKGPLNRKVSCVATRLVIRYSSYK